MTFGLRNHLPTCCDATFASTACLGDAPLVYLLFRANGCNQFSRHAVSKLAGALQQGANICFCKAQMPAVSSLLRVPSPTRYPSAVQLHKP